MDAAFAVYIAVGFIAQLVDGALGMAFGVITSSFLLATGAPPAVASASVHAAEIFTTGLSGLSHLYHRNIDYALFRRLAVAGVLGGVVGAYVLTTLPEAIIRPAVAIYLCLMGLLIVVRAFTGTSATAPRAGVVPLGFAGGLLDATGGGGWGPIVVSTLISRGNSPRFTIGSVNLAELFVTVAVSITFLTTIGFDYMMIVLGLVIGGGLAAPLAGYMSKRLPPRLLMILVAAVVLLLSGYNLFSLFAGDAAA